MIGGEKRKIYECMYVCVCVGKLKGKLAGQHGLLFVVG